MRKYIVYLEPETYDDAITVFSPEGRLLQVEYAFEAVKRGSTVLGISCPKGIVLGAEERVQTELQDNDFDRKIFEVDEHIGAAVAGLSSDAQVLVDQARIYAQINRLTYDEPVYVEALTKRIGDMEQAYTQHAWVRPFGASIIFGGVDKTGNRLFATGPSGYYLAYKAVAEGSGREAVETILREEYREDMKLDEAVKLAVKCLEAKGKVRIAVIPSKNKKFRLLTAGEARAMTK